MITGLIISGLTIIFSFGAVYGRIQKDIKHIQIEIDELKDIKERLARIETHIYIITEQLKKVKL